MSHETTDDETAQFWKEEVRPLYWDCPQCGGDLVQVHIETQQARAICTECDSTFDAEWTEADDDLPPAMG